MIKERVSPLASASLELVLLRAGGYPIACPSDQVGAMVARPQVEPWSSLENLLGLGDLEPVNGVGCHYLQIHLQQKTVIISIPSPPSLVRIDANHIYPLPKLLRQHCCLRGLTALGFLDKADNRVGTDLYLLIFDFRQL